MIFKKYKKMGFVRGWYGEKPVCDEPMVIWEFTDRVGDKLVLFSDGRLVIKKEGTDEKRILVCLKGIDYRSVGELKRLLVSALPSLSYITDLITFNEGRVSTPSPRLDLVFEHRHKVLTGINERRIKNKRLSDLYQVSFVTRQNYKRALKVYGGI